MTNSPTIQSLPTIRENEFLPSVDRWLKFGGIMIAATLGLAIPLASTAKYKETVKAQASLRPAGELAIVQAATEGQILNIAVKENQAVKQGELIATINDSQLQTQKSQLETNIDQGQRQLVQIKAQISTLNLQIEAETYGNNRAIAAAESELERRRREYRDKQLTTDAEVREAEANVRVAQKDLQRAKAEMNSSQANLKSVEASYRAAQSKHKRYQSVAAQGALSVDHLEEAKLAVEQQQQAIASEQASVAMQRETVAQLDSAVVAARARLARVQTYLNPSQAEIAIAEANIAQEEARGRSTLATLHKEQQALLQQQLEIDKQLKRDRYELRQVKINLKQTKINAPVEGIIKGLALRNSSQTVRPGEQVAQIVPSNAALEIKTKVQPQDISKLEVGQDVKIRVSACPYPDYGTLKGQVKVISADTITPQAQGNPALNSAHQQGKNLAAFYEVTIEPESLTLGKGKNLCSIQLGMEGRADIIAREETALQFLLRKSRLMVDL